MYLDLQGQSIQKFKEHTYILYNIRIFLPLHLVHIYQCILTSQKSKEIYFKGGGGGGSGWTNIQYMCHTTAPLNLFDVCTSAQYSTCSLGLTCHGVFFCLYTSVNSTVTPKSHGPKNHVLAVIQHAMRWLPINIAQYVLYVCQLNI